jgi:glycosyltransferase involved in cell wall biosynthesis
MTRTPPQPPTVFATNPNADLYGASRMFLESVEGMAALGWRVVVSIAEPSGPLLGEIRAAGCEERSVPSPVLRKTYLNGRGLLQLFVLTLRSVPAEIRALREIRPDVIYVNTITQPLWLVLGRCLRIPVVCHVHEAEASARRWVRKVLAMPLALARRLIINSRFSMKVLTDVLPRVEERCVVIANGVTGPAHVEPPRPTLEAGARLLYVGRLSDRKGTTDAIEAVRLLRGRGVPAELDIVGAVFPGREAVETGLRQQVADAKLEDHVRFVGFKPTVWPSLAACDILLVPSRTDEPFGNTAIEGMLAARPVIATGIGGLVEATEGFEAALTVPPSAPDAIADAVEQVVAHWNEFREYALVDAGRAADRHSPAGYRSAVARVVGETAPAARARSGIPPDGD